VLFGPPTPGRPLGDDETVPARAAPFDGHPLEPGPFDGERVPHLPEGVAEAGREGLAGPQPLEGRFGREGAFPFENVNEGVNEVHSSRDTGGGSSGRRQFPEWVPGIHGREFRGAIRPPSRAPEPLKA
jgi:hypothetical protein